MDGQLVLPVGDLSDEAEGDARQTLVAAPGRQPTHLRRRLIASDAVAIVVGIIIATAIQAQVRPIQSNLLFDQFRFSIAIVPLWLVLMGSNRLFVSRAISRRGEELRRLFIASASAAGVIVAVLFLLDYKSLSRLWVGLLFVCVTGSLFIARSIDRRIFTHLRRQGRLQRTVIIVGTGPDATALYEATKRRPELGYSVLGCTGEDHGGFGAPPVLGPLVDTFELVERTGATGVIVSVSSVNPSAVNQLTRRLTDAGRHVALSSSLIDIDMSRARAQDLDGRLMIYVEPTNRSTTHLLLKRAFDIVVSAFGLLLSFPVLLVATIAIKVESSGGVFFKQRRVGQNGKMFEIYKLRSMVADAEALKSGLADRNECDGPLFKMSSDPRVTRVGRILRKTSIDELPQLWNVLRGDMSIVGPRPALPEESTQWAPELHDRVRVLPGITGMWQVSGRSDADFEAYRRLDLYYVDNWSLLHDLRIVLKTFAVVLFGRGAH